MSRDPILHAADQCVFCGLCLPHCPTYRQGGGEPESPRGRISLIQGLLRGTLAADRALVAHLDHCLACRACERMCPSKVPYGRLIDAARERLLSAGQRSTPAPLARLLDAVESPGKLQKTASALRLYQRSGVQKLARGSGLLKGLGLDGLERQLPAIPQQRALHEHYPVADGIEARGRVSLFRGCIGSLLEGEVHERAIGLLNRLGFEVFVPADQGCCGSLHQHHGDHARALELAQRNARAFAGLELDALLGSTVGCVAQLLEYPQALESELGAPVFELCDFLGQQVWPGSLRVRPVNKRVALHLPCSQRNIMRRADAPAELLSRVPGLEVVELPGNELCCGAAGSYLLTQPERAEALAEPKREAFVGLGAELLVSNNIGCANHIAGESIEVLHPLQLINIE